MQTNKAAVWSEPHKIRLEERPVPVPAEHEVLVKIKYVGLCGSDLHFFTDGRIGSGVLNGPRVFGHEASGYVEAVGSHVTGLKPGDPVVVDPGQSCGQCSYCQSGRYNLCERAAWDFLGTSKKDGALQQYLCHPASRVYRLPDGVSLLTGALLEPYSVATHAVSRIAMKGGGYTVVMGCGCIGLMAILSIKQRFNTKIIAIDVLDKRLQKAADLGADFIINSANVPAIDKTLELTGGQGADYVFETAGVPYTVGLTADLAKRGGKIVFVGTTVDTHVTVHFNAVMRKELDMTTVFRYAGELKSAVDELEREPFSLDRLVTHTYPFEEVQSAFENNIRSKDEVVKTVIEF